MGTLLQKRWDLPHGLAQFARRITYKDARMQVPPDVVATQGRYLITRPMTPSGPMFDPLFQEKLDRAFSRYNFNQMLRKQMYGDADAEEYLSRHTPEPIRQRYRERTEREVQEFYDNMTPSDAGSPLSDYSEAQQKTRQNGLPTPLSGSGQGSKHGDGITEGGVGKGGVRCAALLGDQQFSVLAETDDLKQRTFPSDGKKSTYASREEEGDEGKSTAETYRPVHRRWLAGRPVRRSPTRSADG